MIWNLIANVWKHTFLGIPKDKWNHTHSKRSCVMSGKHQFLSNEMCGIKKYGICKKNTTTRRKLHYQIKQKWTLELDNTY